MRRAAIFSSLCKLLKYILVISAATSLGYLVRWFHEITDKAIFFPSFGSSSSSTIHSEIAPPRLFEIPVPNWQEKQIIWSNNKAVGQNNRATEDDEDMMVPKAFAGSMGPFKLIPYYFKAKATHLKKDDITISTQATHDRFPILSRLATHYQGPISVACHIHDNASEGANILADLHKLYWNNPSMQEYVDVHLIVDKLERQINMWRNVAKLFARTEYLLMLDIDFHICTNFRKTIHSNAKLMKKLRSGTTAFVIPAFEFVQQSDGLDPKTFPTTKANLLHLVSKGQIEMFHSFWKSGHGPTNYSKWYLAKTMYTVTDYNVYYEPYVVFKKAGSPWCDERFIGYGANKIACIYEMYLNGIQFVVLPDEFLIHQSHLYPEEERKLEKYYNGRLFYRFREEACMRYLRMFNATGQWGSPRASNAKKECKNVPKDPMCKRR
jgi:hypothetical protein